MSCGSDEIEVELSVTAKVEWIYEPAVITTDPNNSCDAEGETEVRVDSAYLDDVHFHRGMTPGEAGRAVRELLDRLGEHDGTIEAAHEAVARG